MEQYQRIEDSIESLSNGQIVRKKRKIIIPVLCIIAGLIMMWWGISKWKVIGYEQTSYILVFGGFFLIGWGIVLLAYNTSTYVDIDSNSVIKPQILYLDPSKQDIIQELMGNGDLLKILKHQIQNKSPLMLELWQADGHKLLYSQLLYHQDSKVKPISQPLVSDKQILVS